jgi:hypothetical protein
MTSKTLIDLLAAEAQHHDLAILSIQRQPQANQKRAAYLVKLHRKAGDVFRNEIERLKHNDVKYHRDVKVK